jgi:mycoredoxin
MFLLQKGITYQWVDIYRDAKGRAFVESVKDGKLSVPTLRFPDGSVLVEPSISELAERLGIEV